MLIIKMIIMFFHFCVECLASELSCPQGGNFHLTPHIHAFSAFAAEFVSSALVESFIMFFDLILNIYVECTMHRNRKWDKAMGI